jgi:hypothetical protein
MGTLSQVEMMLVVEEGGLSTGKADKNGELTSSSNKERWFMINFIILRINNEKKDQQSED